MKNIKIFILPLLLLCHAQMTHASLTIQSSYWGYTNASSDTVVNATPPAGMPSGGANLILNGSFETGAPVGIAGFTGHDAYGTPLVSIPSWLGTGGTLGGQSAPTYPGNYGEWGNLAGAYPSDIVAAPNGSSNVYFGNSGSRFTGIPAYGTNGIVTGITSFTPTVTNGSGTPVPVTLSQAVNGLTPGNSYSFSFWASGERAPSGDANPYTHDGVFQLNVTGESSLLLAAPRGGSIYNSSRTSGLGQGHYYQFDFTPSGSSVTFDWINYGHIRDLDNIPVTINGSELVLDDVTLLDLGLSGGSISAPEPTTLALCFVGIGGLLVRHKRKSA
jgi:hypothetical protein